MVMFFSDRPLARALNRYKEITASSITSLSKDQESVLVSLVDNQQDCFVVLPTGSGKSLIFEMAPIYHEEVHGEKCKILVIELLDIIIAQEVKKFPGKATKIDKGFSLTTCSEITYMFAHPEQVRAHHRLFKTLASTVKYVFIDEAHLILDWGEEFRPAFSKLGELASVLTHAKFVAMTATATSNTVQEIARKLNITNYTLVMKNPVRENIYLSVAKRHHCATGIQESLDQILVLLFNDLKDSFPSVPRTILYVTQHYMAYAYQKAKAVLGEAFWQGDEEVVAEYHSSHAKQQKRYVELALRSNDSNLRLVMATVALGVGADLSLVERIIHIRPPSNLEAYTQEVGRAGRLGQESTAVLYYNKADLHNTPDITSSMKEYCVNEQICRRTLLAKHFCQMEVDNAEHLCCDICSGSANTPPPMPDRRVMELVTVYIANDPTGELMTVLNHNIIRKVAIAFTEGTVSMERLVSLGLTPDIAFSLESFLAEAIEQK